MELLVASLREVCWHFRIMEISMEYLDTTGRIFDVQRYSIHDGPGIRTIVFFERLCAQMPVVLQSGIPGI